MAQAQHSAAVSFIFSVADILRGPYKPNQYGKVILPLTVLRRMDCVLAATREKVLAAYEQHKDKGEQALDRILCRAAGQQFYNTSKLDFAKLTADPDHIARNLTHYIKSFSPRARDIFEKFGFREHIEKLEEKNRLYLVVSRFAEVDFHPGVVTNQDMGYVFEELVRKYNEDANETAGDHFTPREVIRLMVNLLLSPDGHVLTRKGIAPTIYDPTCGTGGMLSVAEDFIRELNPDARPEIFGQDYNEEAYAICSSDMLMKGHSIDHIVFGDTLGDGKTGDGFPGERFDYMLSNPPFGVKWEPEQDHVTKEHETQGFSGRFGPGLPRITDGSLLFLLHMMSKMKPADKGGTRLGIVFNGSPLFTGDAGSGESEIRRWIIENDMLEAIVALPDQLFYNTGIFTYIWIVTNRKAPERRGKVQLVNGTGSFIKMRKSLGNKRNEIGDGQDGKADQIGELTRLYGGFATGEHSKVFDNADFGFRKITVERPLRLRFEVTDEVVAAVRESAAFGKLAVKEKGRKARGAKPEECTPQERVVLMLEDMRGGKWTKRDAFLDQLERHAVIYSVSLMAPLRKAIVAAAGVRDQAAEICVDADGNPEPDAELRDYENVPLKEDIRVYFDREVRPYVPDAWINETVQDEKDGQVGKVGYEIPFTRHFYKYVPPRPLAEIEADLKALESDIVRMLGEVTR